ncbi:MAG: hypothetical protein KDI03_09285 [Anaerolineae bacterium]|nr:hypothetical protein [Anaerolineae bacterium]MCB0253105.1 hypothetical protein [Anaerolineae bacterium]
MWTDPIVEEIRQAREAYAKQFNYDLDAIFEDLKRLERESGREVVSFPPRPARQITRLERRPTPVVYKTADVSTSPVLRESGADNQPVDRQDDEQSAP